MNESGNPQQRFATGMNKAEAGDIAEAVKDLAAAADSGDPEVSPEAAHALGQLVWDSDVEYAEWAFKLAIGSGQQDPGTRAAFSLAQLYQERQRLDAALEMYELAILSPDESIVAQAREAVRSLGAAHAARTAEMSPAEAAFTEGLHLRASGDLDGATAAFGECMASGDAEFAPYAGCQLGAIMAAEDQPEKAKSPLWFAVRSEHEEYAPIAAYLLAEILLDEGDHATPMRLLPVAQRHPEADIAEDAAAILAELRAEAN